MTSQQDFMLMDYPYPPTVNQAYATVQNRRIKSKAYNEYMNQCRIWMLKRGRLINETRTILGQHLNENPEHFVSISIDLIVEKSVVFTKSGKNKKVDATNRIKLLLDVLCPMLHFDDSRVFLGSVEFVVGRKKTVNLKLSITKIRAENEK